jgi:glutathione S-transferase
MFCGNEARPLSTAAQAAADKLVDVATRLVKDGSTTLFSTWSIADADLGFMLQRLVMNGDPVPDELRAYADAQWRRPSVKAYVDHERPRG